MIPDYDEKLTMCLQRQLYACPACGEHLSRYANYGLKVDLHHKMPNTKGNRKRYPRMIDSVENLVACHHACHMNHPADCGSMTDLEAEAIERRMEAEQ